MAFCFRDLDDETRRLMLDEADVDISLGRLYLSKRFTEAGARAYPDLLRDAIARGNEESLAAALRALGAFAAHEPRRKPSGGTSLVKVPVTAPDTFAQGEFNRFYMRAVCRRALESGTESVTIYRAMAVQSPRPESEARIGSAVPAASLLKDLRENVGIDTFLGLPPGPNSGLSVRL